MRSICEKLKGELESLIQDKSIFDNGLDSIKKGEYREILDLKKGIGDKLSLFDKLKRINEARETMGKDFLGPEDVEKTFGADLKLKDIPDIPFSKKELEFAKVNGQFLVLRVGSVDEEFNPLTIEKMDKMLSDDFQKDYGTDVVEKRDSSMWFVKDREYFYVDQPPRAGWALVAKEMTESTNIESFTKKLIKLSIVLDQYFRMGEIPKKYHDIVDEFLSINKEMRDAGEKKEDISRAIVNLKMNTDLVQTPAETVYDHIMYLRKNGEGFLSIDNTENNKNVATSHVDGIGYQILVGMGKSGINFGRSDSVTKDSVKKSTYGIYFTRRF